MRKAKASLTVDNVALMVSTEDLCKMLCCGRPSAVRIGQEAEARIQTGRRVFWNVSKIRKYLDSVSS